MLENHDSDSEKDSVIDWDCLNCFVKDPKRTPKLLFAFDFDNTILNESCDSALRVLIKDPIPKEVLQDRSGANWSIVMEKVLDFIHKEDITLEMIKQELCKLQLTPGMRDLLGDIQKIVEPRGDSHLIIVSDANDIFIQTVLDNLNPPCKPQQIFSNFLSELSDTTKLTISPAQDSLSHNCHICPKNMCKSVFLKLYIEKYGPFDQVFYIGDGTNDLCPALKLGKNDKLFYRKGFLLEKIILSKTFGALPVVLKCAAFPFSNAQFITKNTGIKKLVKAEDKRDKEQKKIEKKEMEFAKKLEKKLEKSSKKDKDKKSSTDFRESISSGKSSNKGFNLEKTSKKKTEEAETQSDNSKNSSIGNNHSNTHAHYPPGPAGRRKSKVRFMDKVEEKAGDDDDDVETKLNNPNKTGESSETGEKKESASEEKPKPNSKEKNEVEELKENKTTNSVQNEVTIDKSDK